MRVGLAVAVTASALAPGTASACINIDFSAGSTAAPGGGSPSFAPGGAVPFTISHTDAGASFSISVDNRPVISDTDADGGGYSGSFTMPDLGDAGRAVDVYVRIQHVDEGEPGQWSFTDSIAYAGRPTSAPSPEAPAPAASPAGGGSAPAVRAPVTAPVHHAATVRHVAPVRDAAPVRRPSARRPAPRASSPVQQLARPRPARHAAQVPAVADAARPPEAAVVSSSAVAVPRPQARATMRARRATARSRPAPRGMRLRAPADTRTTPVARPRARAAEPASQPAELWIVLALAAMTCLAVAGLLVWRRPSVPEDVPDALPAAPPPERGRGLAIEAELQEILAEDRARKVLERLGH